MHFRFDGVATQARPYQVIFSIIELFELLGDVKVEPQIASQAIELSLAPVVSYPKVGSTITG